MQWRFCQRIEQLGRMGEGRQTEPARHPVPLGDALLDKRNASYRLRPLTNRAWLGFKLLISASQSGGAPPKFRKSAV